MKLCAVCFKQKPEAQCHPQYGGVGRWFACSDCIEAENQRREAKGQRFEEKPLTQGRQRIPGEVLNLWTEESDEDTR